MTWTTTPPSAPGWYGWRKDSDSEFVRYDGFAYFGTDGVLLDSYFLIDGDWCGPLEEITTPQTP